MQDCIISEYRLTLSSLGTRRNIQDLTTETDLATSTKLDTDTYYLNPNNSLLNNTSSTVTLTAIVNFLHLTVDAPANVTLTNGGGSITFVLSNYLVLTSPFSQIVIENLSQTVGVNLKVISS